MATNPNTFIGLGMPSALANAVSQAIDAAGGGGGVPDDGSVTDAKVAADANIALNKLANTAAITTVGGTTIPAGNIQTALQAIADLADPGG